jgi:nitroimidazol reductase NimA-like FMN-containing flavoprotein (pyridoxamine 5'-phosphate oxidase superfamily)
MVDQSRRAVVDRPHLPDGYGVPADDDGLLPWEHVERRLREAQSYWVATVDPAGAPHATPIWGSYVRDMLFLDGSPETKRGRNLASNPRVTVHLESASDVVIVQGTAEKVRIDESLAALVSGEISGKYSELGFSPSAADYLGQEMYAVRPRRVFAWTEFPKTLTRFRFDD